MLDILGVCYPNKKNEEIGQNYIIFLWGEMSVCWFCYHNLNMYLDFAEQ